VVQAFDGLNLFDDLVQDGDEAGNEQRERTKTELHGTESSYHKMQMAIEGSTSETIRMNKLLEAIDDRINWEQNLDSIEADEAAHAQRRLIDKHNKLCMIHEQCNRHGERT
jgi:hypothetical protein